ncbi:RNA-binding domain-containing protein [Alloscardovia venturai]|uniref:RNA-binding domain-containing protein n=1 Tax=Alloscardovia venturai TaxID=1769421 RepID=A0ABW2Y4K9_9BIFI
MITHNGTPLEDYAHRLEGQYFDRKSCRIKPKDVVRHVIAFANASGGILVIGIEDDGAVRGFTSDSEKEANLIENAHIVGCTPTPTVKSERVRVNDSEFIIVLHIEVSTHAVIRSKADAKVYLRIADTSRELSHEQITHLEYEKNQRAFEDEIAWGSSINDIDTTLLAEYKDRLHTSVSDEKLLTSRSLMRDGQLTNAGVLLFSQNPTKFLPQARVRVLRFEGNQMEAGRDFNLVKDQPYDLPIPRIIQQASVLISSMLREFQYLSDDGVFEIIPEYPEFAWFEGLVNAVIHRDYSFAGDYIRISMFNDHLDIFSPGALPNNVTLENMRSTRYARNPRIARTLVEFGWARELNEGVGRIYTEMQKVFLHDPEYSEPNHSAVLLTLKNSITSRALRTQDTIEDKIGTQNFNDLTADEKIAVNLAYTEGKVTVKTFATAISVTPTTARKKLKSLAQKNVLSWHGHNSKDPQQYYSLTSINEY